MSKIKKSKTQKRAKKHNERVKIDFKNNLNQLLK